MSHTPGLAWTIRQRPCRNWSLCITRDGAEVTTVSLAAIARPTHARCWKIAESALSLVVERAKMRATP